MDKTELKHVIALLLEDAKRLQQVEPNAGTEARIWLANKTLNSFRELSGFVRGSGISTDPLFPTGEVGNVRRTQV